MRRRGGCRVRVDFLFFALLCAAALWARSGLLAAGLLSAALHEAGHLAAMALLPGQKPSEIRVTPFGIRIQRAPLADMTGGRLPVLAAGSATNLLLALLTWRTLPRLAGLNLVMGLTNLLPVDSLDGGGIARILLERFLSDRAAERALTLLSLGTLGLMSYAGVRVLFRTRGNFSLLALALWMLASLAKRLVTERAREKEKKRAVVSG